MAPVRPCTNKSAISLRRRSTCAITSVVGGSSQHALVLRHAACAHRETGRRVRHHEPFPRPPLVGVAELEVGVDAPLAQREGGATHNIPANVGRVPLEAVQSPPQIEMGGDPQVPLAEVYEDGDLSNGVGLEMSYLEHVEMKKPAEKGPYGQCKALLVEGLEHDRLVRVLRSEFLPVAALPPGDLLLREEVALDEVMDVALLERALLPRR